MSIRPHFQAIDISETSRPIAIKFNQSDKGKAVNDFGPDRIKTLVSMAKHIFHRIIMGDMLWSLLRIFD